MKTSTVCGVLLGVMLVLGSGCASSDTGFSIVGGPIPAESPFAKIQAGMVQKEVVDLVGPPSDSKLYSTGKMWNPFYFGHDTMRTEYIYKGQGRLTFVGQTGRIYKITYNPTESGYNK